MSNVSGITLAAKCAPKESILEAVAEAGLTAVELYLDNAWLHEIDQLVKICKKYSHRYAIHAPTEGYEPDLLIALAEQIQPEVMVFHDIYWEDEWAYLIEKLKPLRCKLCLENVMTAVDTFKYMRRFGVKMCLDLEHLVLEVCGIFEEAFINIIRLSQHVHMSGYVWGSQAWHTHLHHAPKQSAYLLNLLRKAGYSGLVVSEARESYQTTDEFKALYNFFQDWENGCPSS